jgi:hypothetical protein
MCVCSDQDADDEDRLVDERTKALAKRGSTCIALHGSRTLLGQQPQLTCYTCVCRLRSPSFVSLLGDITVRTQLNSRKMRAREG